MKGCLLPLLTLHNLLQEIYGIFLNETYIHGPIYQHRLQNSHEGTVILFLLHSYQNQSLKQYPKIILWVLNLITKQQKELETYKKIAEFLAEELSKHIWLNDKDAILKIYREKAEEDETYS